ncbi:MAG: trypsin-like peptidase domain-containing protein [Saprospiraceae bacterium]|nr:trypsin-like peptidase domain-containing protein [Candidatus Brachybacter algidus]
MKQFFSLLVAGLIGGAATVGGLKYYEEKNNPKESLVKTEMPVAKQVSYAPVNVPFDFTLAASKSLEAVVHIKAAESRESAYNRQLQEQRNDPFSFFFSQRGPAQGSGSGVIISEDGYIVTNNHVVSFADELEVTLHDGRTFMAKKVGTYPKADVAVIKIIADDLHPITYGNSDDVKVGEWALAVVNPLNLTSTVTAGIISAKGRSIDVIHEKDAVENFIQTDAAVNPGNSGGALVDVNGNLIGINSAIASPTGTYAGYAFAIPVNQIIPIVENIMKNKGNYTGPNLGAKATLGVQVANVQDMSDENKEEYGIDVKSGVLLLELFNGGSAQYSGLLPNDVITGINNKAINTIDDLKAVMTKLKPEDVISVAFKRGGQSKQLQVKLRS